MKIHPLILLSQGPRKRTIRTTLLVFLTPKRQIQDLCQEGEDKGYIEEANDPILESISQEFRLRKR